MVSFRPKKGSWLALAALGLQLALSFAHVHVIGIRSTHEGTAVSGATVEKRRFPEPEPGGAGNDYCAICASIQLAANSLVPQTPQLPTIFVFRTIDHAGHVARAFLAAQRTAFQARAPPFA
jgi:hypothetical protein